MSGITYDYIENYLRKIIPDTKGILQELELFAKEHSVPIVQKETAQFLELMIKIKKPKRILELGSAIGYSSILMCLSSNKNVHIDTIERDENMIKLAKSNILKAGLEDNIKLIQGDCLQVLENLNDRYDLIFMDAGKGHYNHFLPECLRLLEKDGLIIADNVLFRGMVATDELVKRRKITIVKRMREYLQMINGEELLTSVIPMGDGIAVTVRREIDE
ncbi:O-methyltransferase [Haloimpatiens massiliensis]|uniref:O-methyltransferase n=1 Tax=Haloimpatiens massiliensis TaxID=1658110 RepID=UPI000C83EE93|nr:O-methyltransferase [Haloimpatiens massiliensis]